MLANFKKYNKWILFGLWLLLQFYFVITIGLKTDLEAAKYIDQANSLLAHGEYSSNNYIFYSTQILLISIFLKLKINLWGVVVLQMLLNLFTTNLFYKFLVKNFDAFTAFIITFLLIINIPFNQYTVFLQTESIYHSLLLIFFVYILSISEITAGHLIGVLFFLLVMLFTRPTGILLLPPSLFYLLYKFYKNQPLLKTLTISSVLILLFFILMNFALSIGGSLDFLLPFETKMIICGVPQGEHIIKTNGNPNSVLGLLYIFINNFQLFMELGWKKLVSFFWLYRDYFSTTHNATLLLLYWPLYILSILGIIRTHPLYKPIKIFALTFIAMTLTSVIFSCDDWHNRFLLTLTPSLLLLSAITINRIKLLPH